MFVGRVLGLDVSTSIIGVTVLDAREDGSVDPIVLDHIDFKRCKTLWEKADHVRGTFYSWNELRPSEFHSISHVFIEEPAMMYSPGMSSAQTIATLLRFNGLVSFFAREAWRDPEYISASAARKLIGIKTQQVKKCGVSHKLQAFRHVMENDLKHVVWPTKKKSDKVVDWAADVVDSYVIARAGLELLNKSQTGE